VKGIMKRVGYGVLAAVLAVAAVLFFRFGFNQLSDVRQLDRLPMTPLAALTQGIYAIKGQVVNGTATVIAPYSNDSVVYYSFRLEEEYRDSDGNRQTRTLDSGESAAPFVLQDSTDTVNVNPGFRISGIEWHAPKTYSRKSGDLIYTEQTLRAGDAIELLAWYEAKAQQIELSEMPFELETIVTNMTLKKAGGNTLFVASLLISLATAFLAVSLASVLVAFGVHRYWFFVVVMTVGLLGALWSIGVLHLQKDWQNAATIYKQRADIALGSNNYGALEDLYAMYVMVERSARQWPDSSLFKLAAKKSFPLPPLDEATQRRIKNRLSEVETSRYSQQTIVIILAIACLFFTVVLIYLALKAIRFKRLVEFIPTSSTTGLAYGISELFGMIDVDDECPNLTSKLNSKKCVAYKYSVEEKRGSGKDAKWVTIDSGDESATFWLEDPQGRVAVNPEGGNIVFPEKEINHSGRTRYTEYWLPPYRNVYCLGFAGIADEAADRLTIKNSDDFEMLITTQEEEEVVKSRGAGGFMLTGLALGFSLMAGTVWLSGSGSLTPLDLIKVSLMVPLTLMVITAILHYNGIIFLKNRVDKTRADIDTLLQRRHDLWPPLLNTVKGFMSHEKKLMAAMSRIRSGQASYSDNPEKMISQLKFERKAVSAFVARIEAYPELKSNTLVQKFRNQIERNEDELALIRKGYNDSVELYNTQIEKLPDVILAKALGFKSAQLFAKTDD